MKSIGYYFGYVKGYFNGYLSGKRAAKKFMALCEQHDGLQHIPTRQLEQIGRESGMFVGRQRIMLAAIALRHLTSKFANNEIPHTVNVVADYLDFKELTQASQDRMVAIAGSNSVVHALATYASTYDALDIPAMQAAMMEKQNLHLWYTFEDNVLLRVE